MRSEGGPFRAHIVDTHEDWVRGTVRLLVVGQRGGGRSDVLMGDGTWQTVEDGTVTPEPPGVVLPRQAVSAVLDAIESWQGNTNHAATEVAVLREALEIERRRVDAVLSSAIGDPSSDPIGPESRA